MNYEWMVERIRAFHATCRTVSVLPDASNRWQLTPIGDELEAKYRGELPTFLKIVRALDVAVPGTVSVDLKAQAGEYRAVAEAALGVALDAALVKTNLAPDAPAVGADHFHPSIWAAAEAIWTTGRYRVAVGAATTSLSAHIAQRTGSALSDRALVQSVFAPGIPTPTQPRLHFVKEGAATDTWKSRQDGLHLIAQGAFAGIRNIAAHTADEWTEQYALEQLAVLSVIARWADETELVITLPEPESAFQSPTGEAVG
ncbi:TIGR02391 family protein [Kribbella sp. NPDC051587]|uniref:TIGR02391 family protein n=1 Tax=Kribbella sp. NPDC051587 TaxID=3364119 RepID=UPI0037891295